MRPLILLAVLALAGCNGDYPAHPGDEERASRACEGAGGRLFQYFRDYSWLHIRCDNESSLHLPLRRPK